MAKARAILKRRKAVKNIRKITRTMQMIATAKFQKSLKRAVGTKPYALKIRELVRDVAASAGDVDHPLLRRPESSRGRVALVLITSNRGLAGGYNGNVIRAANSYIKKLEAAGSAIDLYIAGKKGVTFMTFQKRAITEKLAISDPPRFLESEALADKLMKRFVDGEIDAVYVAYMNFISTGNQKPDVMTLLPLAGVQEVGAHIARNEFTLTELYKKARER